MTTNSNFDSIISKSNNVFSNYRDIINKYIDSHIKDLNNSKFNNVNDYEYNNGDNNSSNNTLKKKRTYLNTYVIPLMYLINSYQYQKYLETKEVIVDNIIINDNLNYHINYYLNYNLPIVRDLNISIYKHYFKNENNNESNKQNNSLLIDDSLSKNIIKYLKDIKNYIQKLEEPYKILNNIEKINGNFSTRSGQENNLAMEFIHGHIISKIKTNTSLKNKLKKLLNYYSTSSGGAKNNNLKIIKDKKFKRNLKNLLFPNQDNNNRKLIDKLSIENLIKLIRFVLNEHNEKQTSTEIATPTEINQENIKLQQELTNDSTQKATNNSQIKKLKKEISKKTELKSELQGVVKSITGPEVYVPLSTSIKSNSSGSTNNTATLEKSKNNTQSRITNNSNSELNIFIKKSALGDPNNIKNIVLPNNIQELNELSFQLDDYILSYSDESNYLLAIKNQKPKQSNNNSRQIFQYVKGQKQRIFNKIHNLIENPVQNKQEVKETINNLSDFEKFKNNLNSDLPTYLKNEGFPEDEITKINNYIKNITEESKNILYLYLFLDGIVDVDFLLKNKDNKLKTFSLKNKTYNIFLTNRKGLNNKEKLIDIFEDYYKTLGLLVEYTDKRDKKEKIKPKNNNDFFNNIINDLYLNKEKYLEFIDIVRVYSLFRINNNPKNIELQLNKFKEFINNLNTPEQAPAPKKKSSAPATVPKKFDDLKVGDKFFYLNHDITNKTLKKKSVVLWKKVQCGNKKFGIVAKQYGNQEMHTTYISPFNVDYDTNTTYNYQENTRNRKIQFQFKSRNQTTSFNVKKVYSGNKDALPAGVKNQCDKFNIVNISDSTPLSSSAKAFVPKGQVKQQSVAPITQPSGQPKKQIFSQKVQNFYNKLNQAEKNKYNKILQLVKKNNFNITINGKKILLLTKNVNNNQIKYANYNENGTKVSLSNNNITTDQLQKITNNQLKEIENKRSTQLKTGSIKTNELKIKNETSLSDTQKKTLVKLEPSITNKSSIIDATIDGNNYLLTKNNEGYLQKAKNNGKKQKTYEFIYVTKNDLNKIEIAQSGGNYKTMQNITNVIDNTIEELTIYMEKKKNKNISKNTHIELISTENFNKIKFIENDKILGKLYQSYIQETILNLVNLINLIYGINSNKENKISIITDLKNKKIKLNQEFKQLKINFTKLNKKSKYNQIIQQYGDTIQLNKEELTDLNEVKQNLEEKIQEKKSIEQSKSRLDSEISNAGTKIKEYDDNITAYKTEYTNATNTRKRNHIFSQQSRAEKERTQIERTKKSKESKVKELENKLNNINQNKEKLKTINSKIRIINNNIKNFEQEKQKYTNLMSSNQSKLDIDSYKNILTDFLNKNIELSRLIIDKHDILEKKEKKDIFKYYFEQDSDLKELKDKFSNSQKHFNKDLFLEIKKYIQNLKSKNKNVIKKIFFSRIMNEINNIKCTKEEKDYLNHLTKIHNNIINKMSKKIDNYEENKISDSSSVQSKLREYFSMFENQEKSIEDIYRNKNKKYINSNKIYVYIYTETIKLYFILLNMMDLYIYNF